MHIGGLQPKASITFKDGGISLEQFAKMISSSDDGNTISFNIPVDVIETSSGTERIDCPRPTTPERIDCPRPTAPERIDCPRPTAPERIDCPRPTAPERIDCPLPTAPAIRPEAQQAIDFLSTADEIRSNHTSRSLVPQYPDGFAAGRFAVRASKDGESKVFVMETEKRVGHFTNVIPGKTRVDGYVAAVSDPYGEVPESSYFNESELEALTVALMRKKPDDQATQYAAAIYSNGDQTKYTKAYIQALEI